MRKSAFGEDRGSFAFTSNSHDKFLKNSSQLQLHFSRFFQITAFEDVSNITFYILALCFSFRLLTFYHVRLYLNKKEKNERIGDSLFV